MSMIYPALFVSKNVLCLIQKLTVKKSQTAVSTTTFKDKYINLIGIVLLFLLFYFFFSTRTLLHYVRTSYIEAIKISF